ncbi:MAG: HAMP domain-containing sensor histidine kinase [Leptolyngbyaceae cyanobacterium bins.302]|nr:HAMP domain-containing sensor histidine kinase [Leptolyngbyaceae cyanobacterium bins.302]
MSQFPGAASLPSLPTPIRVDFSDEDDGLAQLLFQENQVLREQIAYHAQLMQLMTHQLATPLTNLSGSVHLLADPDLELLQRQEFLGIVQQQVQRLQDLLKDMMALRDLESGKLETHPTGFCLKQLITETMQDFAPYPAEYHFAAEVADVWGDRWQISQVLTNLLSNAIKYSPDGRSIEIGAGVTQPGWVEVWVKDHGLGIPVADQPHLFNRFYRVKHRDRQHIPGTGLGLSLCKMLVENQGGQLGFESTHGQGSRFFFTLPVAAVARH